MVNKNLVRSIQFLQLVNEFDNISNNILYSKEDGYLNLTSEDAVKNIDNVINKYNLQIDKILRKFDLSGTDLLIEDKKAEFLNMVSKHYDSEVLNWAHDVYDDMISNCLFYVTIYKNNQALLTKIFNRVLGATLWICEIEKYSDTERNNIISNIKIKFNDALNSSDNDFLEQANPEHSDIELFLNIRKKIIDNFDEFIKLNVDDFNLKLNTYDINYFKKIQGIAQVNKTSVIDEITLVNCAIDVLKIQNTQKVYDFIKCINDDFKGLTSNCEDDKINILKRRMKIYTDKKAYYTKLLTF